MTAEGRLHTIADSNDDAWRFSSGSHPSIVVKEQSRYNHVIKYHLVFDLSVVPGTHCESYNLQVLGCIRVYEDHWPGPEPARAATWARSSRYSSTKVFLPVEQIS